MDRADRRLRRSRSRRGQARGRAPRTIAWWCSLVWSMNEAHRQIERFDVLGERADGDALHARLGDGAHRFERDAAGGLELGAVARDPHRLAHAREIEVVEEDQLRPGVERLAQLADRL